MKTRAFILAIALISFTASAQHAQRRVERSYDVTATPAVEIEGEFCTITVVGTKAAKAEITVTVDAKAGSKERARDIAENGVDIEIDGSRDAIYVHTDLHKRTDGSINVNVDVQVSVPFGSHLEIENKFGSISVEGIQGSARLIGKHGDVSIIKSGNATIRNQFGSMNIGSMTGKVEAYMKHGSVQCHGFKGGRIYNEFGSITISDPGGYVEVTNKMGSIEIRGLIDGKVENQYGNIELTLDRAFTGKIQAGSKFGSIDSNLGLKKRESGNSVLAEGSVGKGEKMLYVQNKFGNITIRK